LIRDFVEKLVQIYCRRTFFVTSYKKKYDGDGSEYLYLDDYPVITLDRLSVGVTEAIRIKNTNAGAHASVSVTSTGLLLKKDYDAATSLLFATYATINSLIAAINATSGWSAEISMSTYGTYPSALLVEKKGLQCINNRVVGLNIPYDGEWEFEVEDNTGIIHSPFGFAEGYKNVYVEYSAGYSETPEDLKLAILILIKYFYQRRSEESMGVTSYSVSGISMSFENDLPFQARQILNNYKRSLS
jgi:hypothetical protein